MLNNGFVYVFVRFYKISEDQKCLALLGRMLVRLEAVCLFEAEVILFLIPDS